MPRNLHNKHIHANNNTHNHDNIRSGVDCHSYQTSGQKNSRKHFSLFGVSMENGQQNYIYECTTVTANKG
jgi:hypothetical protein